MPDGAGLRLAPDGILVVVGSQESIDRLYDLAGGTVAVRREGPFVVGGGGEVGRKVAELLKVVGEEVKLIDRQPGPEVDLVGDVLDVKTLEEAGVKDAQAVILALDTDSSTLFATVILKDLAPEVPVIARVNQAENVERIHRAGADFALSISQVSGQMLAKKLLGQESVAIDPQLKILKIAPDGLAGRNPAELAHPRAHRLLGRGGRAGRRGDRGSRPRIPVPARGRGLHLRQQQRFAAVPGGVWAGVADGGDRPEREPCRSHSRAALIRTPFALS